MEARGAGCGVWRRLLVVVACFAPWVGVLANRADEARLTTTTRTTTSAATSQTQTATTTLAGELGPAAGTAFLDEGEARFVPCESANAQSPRDVNMRYEGRKETACKALSVAEMNRRVADGDLKHFNTHFHLGAEHRSDGRSNVADAFNLPPPSLPSLPPAPSTAAAPRAGYFCRPRVNVTPVDGAGTYEFKHCSGVQVGYTYEIHWLFSSAANGTLSPGMSGAAPFPGHVVGLGDCSQDPSLAVWAQVVTITNDSSDSSPHLLTSPPLHTATVNYVGSTTGTTYTTHKCSPYVVSWQIDDVCRSVSAKSLDDMCEEMQALGMEADTRPHGSRELIAPTLLTTTAETISSQI